MQTAYMSFARLNIRIVLHLKSYTATQLYGSNAYPNIW